LRETGQAHAASPTGPRYYFEHSLRVAFWCWRLALEIHADVSSCVAAGLLHDVSRFESKKLEIRGTTSAATARAFMEKEGFKKEFVDIVAYAIENQALEGTPKTLETRILQDANKMDEYGYLRLLIFARTTAESFSGLEESANSLLAEIGKLDKGSYGQMWTSMGKARMATQITLYKTFLRGLLEEIENTRTTMR
jgi:HD superfamily phosphodiesterase